MVSKAKKRKTDRKRREGRGAEGGGGWGPGRGGGEVEQVATSHRTRVDAKLGQPSSTPRLRDSVVSLIHTHTEFRGSRQWQAQNWAPACVSRPQLVVTVPEPATRRADTTMTRQSELSKLCNRDPTALQLPVNVTRWSVWRLVRPRCISRLLQPVIGILTSPSSNPPPPPFFLIFFLVNQGQFE